MKTKTRLCPHVECNSLNARIYGEAKRYVARKETGAIFCIPYTFTAGLTVFEIIKQK